MIKAIKRKFIFLSMTVLFLLLTVIVTGMNIINYNTIVADADDTLDLLSKNRGTFPQFTENDLDMPKHMNPETPYESRYFSVLLNENNEVIQTDTSRIKAIDPDTAISYASSAIAGLKTSGFIKKYRFQFHEEGTSTRIVFLDCGRKLDSFYNFLIISIGMALVGYLAFFFIILFFSGKIIRPVTESYEKQKQFITDAGHEIKTPLAIIQADVDVLELDYEGNEWLEDIRKQTKRLASLTNDLVYLSRMEESSTAMQMIPFPLSDVISETASSFQALAQTQNKNFTCNVEPMISFTGNEKAIRQLVNILMDNALKYSPPQGSVALHVQKQNRQIRMTVYNTTSEPLQKEKLHLLFERFYRMDTSRSSQTGGYGIGLSVAKAIVNAHGGKIQAVTEDGNSLEIVVTLPVKNG